jgi:hypothetical protein
VADPFKDQRPPMWGCIASITAGAVGWAYLTADLGGQPAWDHPLYFSTFTPLLLALSAGLGFYFPYRPWHWGALLIGAQAVVAVIMHPFGDIVPVGITLFVALAIPALALSYGGAFARKIVLRNQGRRL